MESNQVMYFYEPVLVDITHLSTKWLNIALASWNMDIPCTSNSLQKSLKNVL